MSDLLKNEETIGGTPGGGEGAPPPIPGTPVTISARPDAEYAAATGTAFYGNFWRSLRWAFDDVTEDYGDDLYERMLRDPQVAACINVIKAGALQDGAQLSPAIEDEDDPQYPRAVALMEACQAMLDGLRPSFDDTLWDMLDGIALGSRVAEVIWDDAMEIRAVKVKPRHSVAFVVDVFKNVVGLLARIPGVGTPVQAGTYVLNSLPPYNMLPREKFAVFTFRPRDNDPRGTSILRPAYNAWWLKMQTWPQYLKFLVQFGTPSLIGYVDAQAQPVTIAGAAQETPQQRMVNALIQLQNGTAAAFGANDRVEPLSVAKDGVAAFREAIDLYDRQITVAILNQTLATMEGQHQARAASETHADVLGALIRQARRGIARMIRDDILCPYLRFKHGAGAEELAPRVTMGSADQGDLSALWTAASNLKRAGYLDDSQLPKLDQLLNLPPRIVTEEADAEGDDGEAQDAPLDPTQEENPDGEPADPTDPAPGDRAGDPAEGAGDADRPPDVRRAPPGRGQ